MKPLSSASWGLFGIFVLWGCDAPPRAGNEIAITGGEEVHAASPAEVRRSVVALAMNSEFFGPRTNRASPFCSGVLLSRHVVLTAAHCVEFLDRQMSVVLFAPSAAEALRNSASQVRKVVGFQRHEKYPTEVRESSGYRMIRSPYAESPESWMRANPGVPPHDLALVRFEGDPPEGFEPVRLPESDAATPSEVTLAGFGISSSFNIADNGVLRFVERVKVHGMDEDSRARLWLPVADTVDVTRLAAGERARGACPGDSGGPAFFVREGRLVLVGILSLGESEHLSPGSNLIYCLGRASSGTAKIGNIYTDVRSYREWILAARSRLEQGEGLVQAPH